MQIITIEKIHNGTLQRGNMGVDDHSLWTDPMVK